MPLYDWKCQVCSKEFEAVGTMSSVRYECPNCGMWAKKKFTPTSNFLIPQRFKRDAKWHMPNGERSPDSAPFSDSNSVHAPRRASFKEKFEENWR